MKRIIFNEFSEEKAGNNPLTLEEENKVIELLNQIKFGNTVLTESENHLIQRFVWNYENLCHHKSVLEGLWATENKDFVSDPHNTLFQIKF